VNDSTSVANTRRDPDHSDQIEAYQNLETLIEGAVGPTEGVEHGPAHGSASDRSNSQENVKKFRDFQQISMLN